MLFKTNIKYVQMCACCQYWDDPTRSAMKPTVGKNIWAIDTSLERLCIKRKIKMRSNARCGQYKSKIEVL